MPEHARRRPALQELEERIAGIPLRERPRALTLLGRLRRTPGDDAVRHALESLLGRGEEEVACRRSARPPIRYPQDLPVVERREEIRRLIEDHQVIVVAGETGSGKTTQLPKICLEMGFGAQGLIGHTQPRRVAARSVCSRIAEETGTRPGELIGYKVRFSDRASPTCQVKLMTDGILLAEIRNDPDLLRYEVLILDEAHERSLNIDFLLGFLKRLLPRRPDLKLIITSATIDTERFSRHFDDAPVISVTGRTWPVEIRYRPLVSEHEDGDDLTRTEGIVAAVDELAREGAGDVLVFLAGEREIRDTAEALRKHHPPHTEILPLYSRLSAADQDRIFQPHAGRRIVLSTNIAETSLTVPGIHYVVDPGRARVSRYSYRTKVQRLPIERISKASANQRAGRCGRLREGVCIRLYSEDDFAQRPEFTEPEIQRTNLASVILQMRVLGLGDPEDFPFVDAPDPRFVRDGYRLLQQIGALDDRRRLTPLGRRIARFPVDPRLARLVLAGAELDCLDEMLVIAAALGAQDPRERPAEERAEADERHRAFADERSDFVSLLNLWRACGEAAAHLSGNKLRKWCRENFISYLRWREWKDVHTQLRTTARELRLTINDTPADYERLHTALLSGFLEGVGMRTEQGDYLGARGQKFLIFPGSGLASRKPRWIMSAERVETSRVFARTVAQVEPAWIERMGGSLLRREISGESWNRRRGQAVAREKISLLGLVLVRGRRVDLARHDPAAARQLFLREGLVNARWPGRLPPFLVHNLELLDAAREEEARIRRRDIVVDEDCLLEFYAERVPPEIVTARGLSQWLRRTPGAAKRLRMAPSDVRRADAEGPRREDYPDSLRVGGMPLKLEYALVPGTDRDGITLIVPVALLGGVDAGRLQWLVPGFLEEKITALIRALPKKWRRNFVPAPDFARACMDSLDPDSEAPLINQISHTLLRMTGVEVPADVWRAITLPPHLVMNIRVTDEERRVLGEGRDLDTLRQQFAGELARARCTFEAPGWPTGPIRDWPEQDISESVRARGPAGETTLYPALRDAGDEVTRELLDSPEAAARVTAGGILRLLALRLAPQLRHLKESLVELDRVSLLYRDFGDARALADAVAMSSLRALRGGTHDQPRERSAFDALAERIRPEIFDAGMANYTLIREILEHRHALRRAFSRSGSPAWLAAFTDMSEQLDMLVFENFIEALDAARLAQLPRYLKAMQIRLDKLHAGDAARDTALMNEVRPVWLRYRERFGVRPAPEQPAVAKIRWLIEEYRVSLFAQPLGVAEKVSAKRLEEAWRAATDA